MPPINAARDIGVGLSVAIDGEVADGTEGALAAAIIVRV